MSRRRLWLDHFDFDGVSTVNARVCGNYDDDEEAPGLIGESGHDKMYVDVGSK